MATLHLGVIDVAYSDADSKGATSTGGVAELLEAEYHVMRVFYEVKMQKIADVLTNALAGELENLAAGKNPSLSDLNLSKVDTMFRNFLDAQEWKQITGQSIDAAEQGVSSRFVNQENRVLKPSSIVSGQSQTYKKVVSKPRPARPAFISSGLYQASFKSWLTK